MAERARQTPPRQSFPRLRTYGNTATTAGSRFSPLFTRESITRFLLSLVLALALWMYVTNKQNPELAWEFGSALPVSTEGLSTGLVVTNTLASVHVRIRADPRVTPVSAASFHTFVNLTGLGPGVHRDIPVHIIADPDIQVVAVLPSRVPVAIDAVQTIHVPVRWRLIGTAPAGYSAGNIAVDPNTVAVSGAHSVVAQISDARIYLDLSQARYSIDTFSKPAPENSQGVAIPGSNRLSLDPQLVHVHVPIIPLQAYKTVPVLLSVRGNPKVGFGVVSLIAQPADITVYGSPALLSHVSSVAAAPISVAGRSSGSFKTHVSLRLGKGTSSHSKGVVVTARLGPVSASSSVQVGVVPQGLAQGLVVHVRPASILVTVVGPLSTLGHAAGRMRAVVYVAGYGIGTYELVPTVHAAGGLRAQGVYPSTVSVTLAAS